jgi:serine/threonine-protein kinase RsbW
MKSKIREMHFLIPSRLNALRRVEHIVGKIARALRFSKDEQDNLAIALTEAVGNAIIHGNKKDENKKVEVTALLGKNRVEVKVKDQGTGFNPGQLLDPLDPKNLMKEHGRGIFILKSLMDDVYFDFSPTGTTVRMVLVKKDNAA